MIPTPWPALKLVVLTLLSHDVANESFKHFLRLSTSARLYSVGYDQHSPTLSLDLFSSVPRPALLSLVREWVKNYSVEEEFEVCNQSRVEIDYKQM